MSFNAQFRDELLNREIFLSLREVGISGRDAEICLLRGKPIALEVGDVHEDDGGGLGRGNRCVPDLPKRGTKARDDRLFLEAPHRFAVHTTTWRALDERFGPWNSVWKRVDHHGELA